LSPRKALYQPFYADDHVEPEPDADRYFSVARNVTQAGRPSVQVRRESLISRGAEANRKPWATVEAYDEHRSSSAAQSAHSSSAAELWRPEVTVEHGRRAPWDATAAEVISGVTGYERRKAPTARRFSMKPEVSRLMENDHIEGEQLEHQRQVLRLQRGDEMHGARKQRVHQTNRSSNLRTEVRRPRAGCALRS
jgi:hypothetical protein